MTLYELIETAIATQQQRADGSLTPVLARSRRAPMRSAVKRYGAFLGIDPETANQESYHLPDHEIKALIDAKAPTTLAANTRRNLANDVISLLRLGVDHGWLAPLPPPLMSWYQRLTDPVTFNPGHQRYSQYALPLADCPAALRDEMMAYIRWCEAPIASNRSRHIAKRPVTSRGTPLAILKLAGFAVRHLGYPIESLTLEQVCQVKVVEGFANWWLMRRGRMTLTLGHIFIVPTTIARHWLKNPELAQALTQLHQSLPPAEAVRQKDEHWLSLQQLEEVGLSLHPLNARRVQEYAKMRKPSYLHRRDTSFRRTSLHIGLSLIIRLLIRLPMRQRCIREMMLGQNLYQDHAGVWQIRFVGKELKVAVAQGAIKRYEFPFPADLVPALEAWVQDWRPKLAVPDDRHIFLNMGGRPFTVQRLADMIGRMTYRFTGTSVNPHMIRDIWATEYLSKFPGDIAGAARRLGNTEQMILKHYSHIIKANVDARAEAFLQQTFSSGKGTTR